MEEKERKKEKKEGEKRAYNEDERKLRILNMAQILDIFIAFLIIDIMTVFKYKFSYCLKMLKWGLFFCICIYGYKTFLQRRFTKTCFD